MADLPLNILGTSSGGISDVTNALGDIFGRSSSQNVNAKTDSSASASSSVEQSSTETFRVDRAAIDKIIQDILASNEGLAKIFTEEQAAGLYDSTVAQKATADLMAKIAGEIAKLTGTKEISQSGTQNQQQQSSQEAKTTTRNESSGLLDMIFGG